MTLLGINYFLSTVFIGCLTILCRVSGSICNNETCISCGTIEDPLQLECPDGEVITGIPEAGFRSNLQDNDCIHKEGDCICSPNLSGHMIRKPMWKDRYADLKFQFPNFAKERGSCPEANIVGAQKYLIIRKYRCVPESQIYSICKYEPTELFAIDGLSKQIISPEFMTSYINHIESNQDQSKCTVNITTSNNNHGIRLSSIFMEIKDARILITDLNNARQWDYNGNDLEVHSNKINIQFSYVKMDNFENGKLGFAIEYSAFQILENSTETLITETPTTEATTQTQSVNTTSTVVTMHVEISSPEINEDPVVQRGPNLPIYILVIVVISCILLILMLGFAVGVIVWKFSGQNPDQITTKISTDQCYVNHNDIYTVGANDSASCNVGDMSAKKYDTVSVYSDGSGYV